MQPIHELLARIRHDPVFGAAQFEIGYRDRFDERILRVPLVHVTWPEGSPRTIQCFDKTVETREIIQQFDN